MTEYKVYAERVREAVLATVMGELRTEMETVVIPDEMSSSEEPWNSVLETQY